MASWVKFHEELTKGAKRALTRATRFIYMELSLRARPKRGVIDLRPDVSVVDAIHEELGGGTRERREVAEAWPRLSTAPDGEDAMVVLHEGPGWRRLVLPSWESWNTVDVSTERVRKHRDAKRNATKRPQSPPIGTTETEVKRVTPLQGETTGTRPEESRGEEIRDPVQARDLPARACAREGGPPSSIGRQQAEVQAIVEAVGPVADVCARSGGADALGKFLHVAIPVVRPGVDYAEVARLACVQVQGELTNGKHRDNRGLANLVRAAFVRLLQNPTDLAAAKGESRFRKEDSGDAAGSVLDALEDEVARGRRPKQPARGGEPRALDASMFQPTGTGGAR